MPEHTETTSETRQFVYSGDPLADAFLRENPFALLLGVIAYSHSEPEQAWKLPFQLRNRLDHLHSSKFETMNERELADLIGREPALHTAPTVMARQFIRAAQLVNAVYQGQTERIWKETAPRHYALIARLRCIDGITRIKAEMMLKILVRDKFVFLNS